MNPPRLYGLLAEFKDGEKLVEIAKRAREAGYRRLDGFSPYPVEGLAEALGSHKTKVPVIALAGGLTGGLGGYFMLYSSAVAFYPINHEKGRAADRERFSGLAELMPIHDLDALDGVDWNPSPLGVGAIKLKILERFYEMAERWQLAPPPPLGPIAPASALPAAPFRWDPRWVAAAHLNEDRV